MTPGMMNPRDLVEKTPDADPPREMLWDRSHSDHSIRWIDQSENEVGAVTGAAYGEKNPARLAQRNGYRERG